MKTPVQTYEDEHWYYGHDIDEDGTKLSDWMKLKKSLWVKGKYSEIIQSMKIPLNHEVLKQLSKYEGDTDFLYKLYYMCNSDQIELTDKQINFMARLLAANNDIHIWALKHFVITGLQAGKSTKDIENKLKEIRSKYETV